MVGRYQVDENCSAIDIDTAPTLLCRTQCPHALVHFSATGDTVATDGSTSAQITSKKNWFEKLLYNRVQRVPPFNQTAFFVLSQKLCLLFDKSW